MICPNCKQENISTAAFCKNCGTKLEQPVEPAANAQGSGENGDRTGAVKSDKPKSWVLPAIIGGVVLLVVLIGIIGTVVMVRYFKTVNTQNEPAYSEPDTQMTDDSPFEDFDEDDVKEEPVEQEEAGDDIDREIGEIKELKRAEIVNSEADQYYDGSLVPSVPEYQIKPDLSDVFNPNDIEYLPETAKKKLAKNLFVVMDDAGDEFFDVYESNRYGQTPNFVTVDSMMHTYHIYFSYLLKKIEKEDLYDDLAGLSKKMYEESVEQYGELKGSEWEDASLRNVAFFTIGCKLLGDDPEVLPEVKKMVSDELELIDGEAIDTSPLFGDFEDYSQYKPRGYYVEDEKLEKYFRGMMWYGRRGFEQRDEDHMRSALLISLALDDEGFDEWESIYTVTSFFAGASDDNTYYELKPLVDAAYGKIDDVKDLIGDKAGYDAYYKLTQEMKTPEINSIPVFETDEEKVIPSFRFMGQRFSIDATIFQKLIYSSVEENSDGDKRMLPDALDVPAVLGSETAYEILEDQGDTKYEDYKARMDELKDGIAEREDKGLWTASLYAQWLNTLRPVLEEKGKGYPSFMQSKEWNKKSIEGFLGSYAELKHDTILYSKQAMAEMGGGWEEEIDDRGYVEPEPVVYSRFAVLAESTMQGLKEFRLLDKDDKENLNRMAELAKRLVVISEKELKDEKLSNEEYDLIRDFGGDIEHIWYEAMKENEEYPRSDELPGAIVADIATDPNGTVLEVGTGRVGEIYVICPVDGTLRVCTGSVYSFYEFPWPISDRLTDQEWRVKIGLWPESGYEFNKDENIKQPDWTQSYRAHHEWDY